MAGEGFWQKLVAIDDLTDVDTTSTPPADGDVLTWDATPGAWVPAAVPGVSADEVRDAGRWEVVVHGVPAVAVMTADETDWVYAWVPG
jgi:hypothetical protein